MSKIMEFTVTKGMITLIGTIYTHTWRNFLKYNVLYIHNALPSKGIQIMICTYFAGNEAKHLRHGTYFLIRNNGGDQYILTTFLRHTLI